MVQIVDTRDFSYDRATEARVLDLGRIAAQAGPHLPEGTGVKMGRINGMTGMPTVVEFLGTGPRPPAYVDRALAVIEPMTELLTFAGEGPPRFTADPEVQRTRGGMKAVHLQQQHRGVPLFGMFQVMRFGSDDSLRDAAGDVVSIPRYVDLSPKVSVVEAATAACRHLAKGGGPPRKDPFGQPLPEAHVDPTSFHPTIVTSFPLPARPVVLDKGPFAAEIPAHLVLFYQGPKMRLGWLLVFTLPAHAGQYAVIVGADDPGLDILYCQEKSWSTRARMRVFAWSPRDDAHPVEVAVPLPAKTYPLHDIFRPAPLGFPSDWVDEDATVGNNTTALSSEEAPERGTRTNEGVAFAPATSGGQAQEVVNAFYFCNYLHDFFYLLGFDEEAGNFQRVKRVGLGGDPLVVHIHQGPVFGTAFLNPTVEGMSPQMHLGVVDSTGRHTALDADVVFHEFVHGVTNRLVGGGRFELQLEQPQSRGMGEGWSDYFALTIQNYGHETERTTLGTWVVDNPRGIRALAYDESFPDDFGKLGTGRYEDEHNLGEIWCAALVQLDRSLGKVLGNKDRGHELGWQLVLGGLPLTRGNPSFLDARDGILQELLALRPTLDSRDGALYRALRKATWATFARFGMGPNARSSGASLVGVKADFSVPEEG